jgi:hypothetical protein
MRSPELKEFILKHSDLFWYTPQDKKVEISDEYLVENILNYGSLSDFKNLERLVGINQLSNIFMSLDGRRKMNIYPEVYNYFYHYFNKYAQRDTKQRTDGVASIA